jgi:hypothetical protein
MILSIKTFSLTTLIIKGLNVTLSITMVCLYAECQYAECRIVFIITLNVIMLIVVMMNVVMMNVLAQLENQAP